MQKSIKVIIILISFTHLTVAQNNQKVTSFPANKTYEITKDIHDGYVKGEVGIFYKKSDIGINYNKITRPFIMVEGFDAGSSNNLDNKEGLYGTYGTMFENLRADGWDVILLNLENNNNKIQDNAELMAKLIRDIHTEVVNNHNTYGTDVYRTTIMGFSMGGLICRYALCLLENGNTEHYTDHMITWDSPHQGANVPLGYQGLLSDGVTITQQILGSIPTKYQAQHLGYWLNKAVTATTGFNLATEAATQMSLNYPGHNDARHSFLADFDDIGKYPKKCRKIAIADGTAQIPMAKPYWTDWNLLNAINLGKYY